MLMLCYLTGELTLHDPWVGPGQEGAVLPSVSPEAGGEGLCAA